MSLSKVLELARAGVELGYWIADSRNRKEILDENEFLRCALRDERERNQKLADERDRLLDTVDTLNSELAAARRHTKKRR